MGEKKSKKVSKKIQIEDNSIKVQTTIPMVIINDLRKEESLGNSDAERIRNVVFEYVRKKEKDFYDKQRS